MDKPANYRISVQGTVPPIWSDRLGGMRLHVTERADGETTSTLVGELRDQAALSGVLDTLYQLHLVILRVEREMPNGEMARLPKSETENPGSKGREE